MSRLSPAAVLVALGAGVLGTNVMAADVPPDIAINDVVSLEQLFRAATIENAKLMTLAKDIGTVAAGKRANLLLLTKNPLKTVEAYDAIDTVFIGGKPIARKELSAARTPAR